MRVPQGDTGWLRDAALRATERFAHVLPHTPKAAAAGMLRAPSGLAEWRRLNLGVAGASAGGTSRDGR